MKLAVKNPLNSLFSKFLNDKRFTVAFSIIGAFVFWLVIMISQNPVREQTFNDIAATIQIENSYAQKQGLSIVSDISKQKFSVVLSGPNYIVSSVKPEDFLLTASIEEVTTSGIHTLTITPTYNSNKSGYTFVSVSPATIDVEFDYIDTKEFEVVPRLEGFSVSDGLIAEKPVVTMSENELFTLTGPRAVLERIKKVEAFAKVNEKLSNSKSYNASVILYDEDNRIIYKYDTDGKIYDGNNVAVESTSTYLSPSFTTIKVTAPVLKKKTVPLKATFSDRPEGATDAMFVYTTLPKEVQVIGSPENIDKLEQVYLSPISYKSISSRNNVFQTKVTAPDGIKLVNEIESVTVTVDYTKTIKNINEKQ